jgi:hypothetical protein
MAMDPKALDDLARRLAESVPTPLKQLQEEMENNLRSVLQGAFSRMNLVTREEFDVQAAVLARSRQKLTELTQRVQELEELLDTTDSDKPATN